MPRAFAQTRRARIIAEACLARVARVQSHGDPEACPHAMRTWSALTAERMSPSAVKMIASSPPNSYCTSSFLQMSSSRSRISASLTFVKRKMAHRLWMGSMISDELLQASAKRVVEE